MSIEKGVNPEKQARLSHPLIWTFSFRQMASMVSGVALYALLNIVFNILQLPNVAGGAIALLPGSVVPLVFGAFCGPIVGFLIGGAGSVISDLISYHGFFWNWELGNALIGFVAGLAVLLTSSRHKNARSIICLEIACSIAIVVGTGFAAYTDMWVTRIDAGAATSEFLFGAISDALNGLILLLIILVARNTIVRNRNLLTLWWMKRAVTFVLLVGLSLTLILASLLYVTRPRLSHSTSAQVTINALQSRGTLSNASIGLNTAVFDPNLLTSSTRSAIQKTGVSLLRFPGGLDSDVYHWQSHALINGELDPRNNFDAFMDGVQAVGSQAMITVDYGAGTPAEAAGWVQYANKGDVGYNGPVPTYPGGSQTGHTYGVKYWEIGNEVYGDSTYVTSWEYNNHPHGALTYARNLVAYSNAMKTIDSTIKIGAVLTAPGIWPDGVISPLSRRPWNQTILSTACSSIDFVVIHWYAQNPGNESDSTLLSSTSQIASMVSTLRDEIKQSCGSHAGEVQIMVTETNSVSYHPGKQTVSQVNALFLADNYMTWLENGVANVDWWNLHDGWAPVEFNNSPSLNGNARFGDYGVLSSHLCSGSICEPATNTPFPPYYALQMLGYLGRSGDMMIGSSSNQDLIAVHAVKQSNGNLAILLINKDPGTSYTVSLKLKGYTAEASAMVYTSGENSVSINSMPGASTQVKIAPYSLTTVVLSPDFQA